MTEPRLTLAIDTGGTFTDVMLLSGGLARVLKVASSRMDPAAAALAGMRELIGSADPGDVLIVHGSTVATNALLERRGARVALLTNRGFEDVLEIGRQNRPELYALSSSRPPPLVPRELRFGVPGRLDARGACVQPLADQELHEVCARAATADAVAVCLLHSYANAEHELQVEAALRAAGVSLISLSSAVLPEYREFERTATTVVNAYVLPVMSAYLHQLERASGARVRVMGSGGGALTVGQARREPVHTILSGPAGGVTGAHALARACGIDQIITFDMGGTSTDAALVPGQPLYTREFVVTGVPVAIPMLDIHTVGAGGGSIAWVDAGGALRVGPHSAGAEPGPVCYGTGGSNVTVTDANVWLRRLPPAAFLGGARTLDRAAIERPLSALAARLGASLEATAEGILTVVNSIMEAALRVISVERGYDPANFTIVAFGGAAGLHAAALAGALGVPRVLLPPHPGLLSALGMAVAPVRKSAARTVLLRADDSPSLDAFFQPLEAKVLNEMAAERIGANAITLERTVDARYVGQSHELRVDAADWVENLHRAHQIRYGYANRENVVEAVTLRVEARTAGQPLPRFELVASALPNSTGHIYADGTWQHARLLARDSIRTREVGPLVVMEYSATTWVPAGWQIEPLAAGALIMERE